MILEKLQTFKLTNYFIEQFIKLDLLTLGAALSFYTAFSLGPLILITLYLLGLWGDAAQSYFVDQIRQVIGPQAGEALISIIESAQKNKNIGEIGSVIGIVTLLFSASGVFSQLQYSMNIIWKVNTEDKSNIWIWVKRRLLSIGLILGMVFLSISSLIASTVITYIVTFNKGVWATINNIGAFLIFGIIFSILIKYLPFCKVSWKSSLKGGAFTSILYTIGKYFIGLYLAHSSLSSAYGAAGTLIVFLIWVYYSSIIVFSGALVAETLERHH